MTHLNVDSLPDPGERFDIQDVIGVGIWAKVHKSLDTQSNKLVAIKIQRYEGDAIEYINEEYRILRDFSKHPNLPEFYGVYRKKHDDAADEIWFILEYCEGGSVVELVRRLHDINKKISEEHIAFILREAVKGLVYLHKNNIIHRDVRGSNILVTSEGEIKVCDFGLSSVLATPTAKRSTCIGSPCWMAPELFSFRKPTQVAYEEEEYADEDENLEDNGNYGCRADVWAIGITAIELGDGAAPFLDMHPTRTMFQILRNPPPTLYRPANWCQNYNDFISECLEKNQENRPHMVEILEHPFFTELIGASGNDHHLSCEIKHLTNQASKKGRSNKSAEIAVVKGCIKKFDCEPEKMYVEDLAALEILTEESILDELRHRMDKGFSYTFVGDVLLSLNSNELPSEFPKSFHNKYIYKSRSENAPHILSVADSAYQDMLHHEEPQNIILAGESYSGKTTNMRHILKHLNILGEGNKGVADRINSALEVVHTLVNAGTPLNPDSTRCALQTQITFGSTGKTSGVIFWVNLLEKLRVSTTDMNQANFHIFYIFYDAISAHNKLDEYNLEPGRGYRYLRIPEERPNSKFVYIRDDPEMNVDRFKKFEEFLVNMDFSQSQLVVIKKILAAILILGNVRYMNDGKFATVENADTTQKVAKLLQVDEKKFQWSLENYCVIQSGTAERRKHTSDEARDARDVLAGTIYCRLVDWIINIINQKLAFGRAVFGDIFVITITDMFGFECFHRNRSEQLMINTLNEQLQYHYNQRMFTWEMIEQEEEEVPVTLLHYYDNKDTIDQLMSKPHGLFYLLDDASRARQDQEFIINAINARKSTHIQRVTGHEFSIAHYTGKLTYDARDLADKNRDFLPPEMVETMRSSLDGAIKLMFTNKLSKTGNLTMAYEEQAVNTDQPTKKSKWGAALMAEKQKEKKKINTLSHGQYSQVHKMRTLSNVFRATSVELLKALSVGGQSGNTHFVRCIRGDLDHVPRGFKPEMVHQQLRALAILDTANAKQKGYSQRISFQEFLRRYKFLAFDFDENVDLTKDNCRLLLIRLKMEGWIIGKTKVFLKYYNVEYLSRLYETQVKKIVKVQSMMRAFLAKRNVATKLQKFRQDSITQEEKQTPSSDEAAITIQKAFRGFQVRQKYGPLVNKRTGKIDAETSKFIKTFAKRWKSKTIFQVLLHYRAARYQDLVNMTQQIHLYNQRMSGVLKLNNACILLEKIDPKEINPALLGPMQKSVHKLLFCLDDIPYFDTVYLCNSIMESSCARNYDSDQEAWDAPFRRNNTISNKIAVATQMGYDKYSQTDMSATTNDSNTSIHQAYSREPNTRFEPITQTFTSEPLCESQHIKEKQTKYKVYQQPPNVSKTKNIPPSNQYKKESSNSIIPKLPEKSSIRNNVVLKSVDGCNKLQANNPVKELELMGKSGATEHEDDPPFNFQSMLRKTNYNRASMKRTSLNDPILDMELNSNITNQRSKPRESVNFEDCNIVYQKTNKRNNDIDKIGINKNKNDEGSERKTNFIQEEIRPGIQLEGYAIEI